MTTQVPKTPFLISSHSHGLKRHARAPTHAHMHTATTFGNKNNNSGKCLLMACYEPRSHRAGFPAQRCYAVDTTLIPLRWQGDRALVGKVKHSPWAMLLGGGWAGVSAWVCPVTRGLTRIANSTPLNATVTISPSKNYINPRRLITLTWGDNGTWWYWAQMEHLASPHTWGSERGCGNPFNGLIIVLSPSTDSIAKSPCSDQSNSESSVWFLIA